MKNFISRAFLTLLSLLCIVPAASAADTTVPVVSRVTAVPNDALSFYVYAYATDDVAMSSVQFPTWTNLNGQDDLASPWPSGSSGSWTIDEQTYNWRYLVKISEHNYEAGNYTIHVYAYDTAGNFATGAITYNFQHVADSEVPVIARMASAQNGAKSFYVYAYATDNVFLKSVSFSAWTGTTEADKDDLNVYEGSNGSWNVDGQEYNWCALVSTSKHNDAFGVYSIQANAYDLTGNTSASNTTFEMVEDAASSEVTMTLDGKDYKVNTLIERQEGPGIIYRRLRVPDFPLNVNLLEVDLNNEYNRIETFQANEQLYATAGGTELLATASKRYTTDEKRVIAGANGNFWCVSSQYPWADLLVGTTFNANLRNGKIITEKNNASDQWCAVPYGAGVVTISPDKTLTINDMTYSGTVANDKIGTLQIQQANKVVRDNEIGLYNSFYGTSKTFMPVNQYTASGVSHFELQSGVTTEVYCNLAEGAEWLGGQSMKVVVQEVKTDCANGSLGSYDLCLVGRGANKTALSTLAAGDELTIDLGYTTVAGYKPLIEQAIGGNSLVMLDGVKTAGNDNQTYNSQVYSRCAYGSSADGKTLYIIVIDKSVDPVYGSSAGCNTRVMCDIASYYGCDDLCNVDAGGSAQMLLNGAVINKTTESNPRSVANGWFVYSTAPADNVIAEIKFADVDMVAPIYSTYSPKVLGYNQYGDLVDENVQGFVLTCDANIGTCDGMSFTAAGTPASGKITATYNGATVSMLMNVVQSELTIRIKPTIIIDAKREYPMEVTATVGENIYTYNPASLEWTVEDESIATIDANGVLRGLKIGTTKITGKVGDFVDETNVAVEIADAPAWSPSDFSVWTITNGNGVKNSSISKGGVVSFTYTSPRAAGNIQLNSGVTYYSLPDRLWMEYTSTIPLTQVDVDMRANGASSKTIKVYPTSGTTFPAGEKQRIELPISTVGDPADLIIYPLSVPLVRFYLQKGSTYNGEHTITIDNFIAEYDNYSSGVESVVVGEGSNIAVYPNPITNGTFTVSTPEAIKNVKVYSASGAEVVSQNGGEGAVTVDVATLPAGIYFVKVATANNQKVEKIIVK